jgi:hypothetical protein
MAVQMLKPMPIKRNSMKNSRTITAPTLQRTRSRRYA